MRGEGISGGIFSRASSRRSPICCLAQKISVPSSKTTVTTDRPNCETDRISSTFGMPLREFSTGKVMNCSVSSAANAGAVVMICTCTLVTSGTASIGNRVRATVPKTIKSTRSMSTKKRLSRAQLISFPPIIEVSVVLRRVCYSPAIRSFISSDLRIKPPCLTMACPDLIPSATTTRPSDSAPRVTGTLRKRSPPS